MAAMRCGMAFIAVSHYVPPEPIIAGGRGLPKPAVGVLIRRFEGKTMATRRDILLGIAGVLAVRATARAQPVMTDEGFYREPWFIESFLDLPDDLGAARGHGKHFALIWE